ncbi:UDP-N-acetylmuramate--L-alanine ligase [Rickettsia endosymbiont of Cardiosporidium cionae]|uniref:UDP-N-acetylmuramate--L-alanine ligase n=1 Tax=Rickettsia endosymbiont of Cardiosporidium cionae TaxID=2777155 RepID=UPI0018933316|nr:UDP-N-acetylmuramate--L-alanine ligase [Rickettsia endosymbiont of Cardiosporidium cionae]KAF8818353.1 UDP-N-acetylmuramate--alanine ligase [Rickettsia endosymbiont of Cardiosporidium cionae]
MNNICSNQNDNYSGQFRLAHIIGIGGIGMSGIAEIMFRLGYAIQGSDISHSENIDRLRLFSIKIFNNHDPQNIEGVSCVIISSAIQDDNIELKAAKLLGIPVIQRYEALSEIIKNKCSIAVSGSHGKTTTTSLISSLFEYSNISITTVNGGINQDKNTNICFGNSNYMIVEADESDGTFVKIPVYLSVVTNIDYEHIDFYSEFNNLLDAFEKFIGNSSISVVCIDNLFIRNILLKNTNFNHVITYAIDSEDALIKAYNIELYSYHSIFDIVIKHNKYTGALLEKRVILSIPGRHNILNALAAVGAYLVMGFGFDVVRKALQNFQGVKRRFNKILDYKGASIIDDYAHHPSEIAATLSVARNIINETGSAGRLIAIIQPHRYSRVFNLLDSFIESVRDADQVYITEIYSAGEKIINNFDISLVISKMLKLHYKAYLIKLDAIIDLIRNTAQRGDVFILMGAGSIGYISQKIVEEI